MYTPDVLIPLGEMGLSHPLEVHLLYTTISSKLNDDYLNSSLTSQCLDKATESQRDNKHNSNDSLILGLRQWQLYCSASFNTNSRSFCQELLSDFSSVTFMSRDLNVKYSRRFPCWNTSADGAIWEDSGTLLRLSLPEGIKSRWVGLYYSPTLLPARIQLPECDCNVTS